MDDDSLDTVMLNKLVAQWQHGDRAAMNDIIARIGERLELLARKMLRGFPNVHRHADTLDVVQGTAMRLMNTLRNLNPASTRDFYNLAAVHVRRELLDLARRTRRIREVPMQPVDSTSSLPGMDPPDSRDRDLDKWTRLHEEVENLPAELRETVGLVFYHGWSQEQIARLFDVDARTIRRWWQKACAQLHDRLRDDMPELK